MAICIKRWIDADDRDDYCDDARDDDSDYEYDNDRDKDNGG